MHHNLSNAINGVNNAVTAMILLNGDHNMPEINNNDMEMLSSTLLDIKTSK